MQLAKKIQIYPTEEQVDVLWQLSKKCRVVYNLALADRQAAYENENRSVKYAEQQNQIAGDHPNLKDGVWFGRPPRTLGT
jgi:putative transposase